MVQDSDTAAMNFDDALGPPAALNGDEAEQPRQEESDDAATSISVASLNPKNNRNCPICHMSFRRNEHLERHVRMHTMERPFVCVVCETRFSRK